MAVRSGDALTATASVCEALDLRPSRLDVLRSSTYVAIRMAATPYMARVGRAADTYASHAREMAIARALAGLGAPVARPAPLADPLVVEGSLAVGLWLWVERHPATEPTMAELGTALRRVHDSSAAVDLGALDLPAFTAPGRARARLRRLCDRGRLDAAMTEELTELVDVLAPDANAGDGLVHGDFRTANVLATATGPVVIDFDAASLGPPAWDLTIVAQQHRHFGLPSAGLEAFLDAYGPIADADGFASLCRLRDVASTVWALSVAASVAPAFASEARRRLASLRDPEDRSPWSWDGLPSARPPHQP